MADVPCVGLTIRQLIRFDMLVKSRYTRPMSNSPYLPPHLERFVHQQIATGRYHSEDEVILAALHLLEGAPPVGLPSGSRAEGDPSGCSRQFRPALTERWQTPAEWRAGSAAEETTPSPTLRSPRGLLADLRSGITFDDFREARGELWAGLHRGEA